MHLPDADRRKVGGCAGRAEGQPVLRCMTLGRFLPFSEQPFLTSLMETILPILGFSKGIDGMSNRSCRAMPSAVKGGGRDGGSRGREVDCGEP